MPRKARTVSEQEILGQLTSALRRTALRPTIEGYTAQDHQIPFHSSMKRGRAMMGGNRSGKTVSGASEVTMWMTGRHRYRPTKTPPVHCRGIAVDFDHGINMIMKPEIARWMPPSELIGGSWERSYNGQTHLLTLENGSTLEFLTYEQRLDQHAGTSRDLIWFDEEPPKSIFNENMARLIDVGGSWILTMTPVEGMTWVYDDIYCMAGIDPNIAVFEVAMDQNVYINQAEIDMYLAGMSDEEKLARRYGRFVQLGGTVYGEHFKASNIIPSIINSEHWDTYRTKWGHVLAMDHGFNNPTCWLWACIDKDDRIIVYDEYYVEKQIISYHASAVLDRTRELGITPGYYVGDPSIRNTDPITGTSIQLEYIENGIAIVPGNNDVAAGINRVARMFHTDMLFVTRNCEKLLWEVPRYRWSRYASKKIAENRNAKDVPVKKDDHACDALRYLIASRFTPELDLALQTKENLFDSSEAILSDRPRLDLELLRMQGGQQYSEVYDQHIGSEW